MDTDKISEEEPKYTSRSVIIQVIVPFSVWTIIFQVIPPVIGQFFDPWPGFFELNSSPVAPPSYLIGIVWSFMYFTVSTYGWYISYELKDSVAYRVLFVFFWIHAMLNWAYQPVFFGLETIVGGFVIGLIPRIITVYLVAFPFFYSKNWELSLLLIPYLIWGIYTSYLAGYIVANN